MTLRCLIVDDNASFLEAATDLLRRQGVVVAFAEMKGPVKDRLRRYGLYAQGGSDYFFPTVGTAVDGYLRATGLEWVDWEERPDRHRKG